MVVVSSDSGRDFSRVAACAVAPERAAGPVGTMGPSAVVGPARGCLLLLPAAAVVLAETVALGGRIGFATG